MRREDDSRTCVRQPAQDVCDLNAARHVHMGGRLVQQQCPSLLRDDHGHHSPVRTDGSPLLSSRIESPIHSAEFKEQFARQVAGVVVQGQDRAEIRLTPAELGPIRIRVSLNADDAALDISAAHAATRAAIESSMSTLKQMLADHGLRLSDYRMDQGNNAAFLSQQRQSGQENGAGMQQSGTAFGQNGGQSGGQQTDGGSDTGRADRTMGSRPTATQIGRASCRERV